VSVSARRYGFEFSGLSVQARLVGANESCSCFFQYLGWNNRQLVAAMQALAIYLIIRLDEDQTEHNDLDFLFVAAVSVGSPLPR
jgi:hypothetical protein